MTLSKKYSNEFLNKYNMVNNKGKIISDIIYIEKETGVELLDWENDQIEAFLKKRNAKSKQTLNSAMVFLRKFADYICEEEGLEKRQYPIDDGIMFQLMNKEELLKSTITYQQYLNIKNQLDIEKAGKKINIRNKLIFELSWEGLISSEISHLKEKDIIFKKNKLGIDVVILKLKKRTTKIEDPEIIEDIKLCAKEQYYVTIDKNGVYKESPYKESKYIVKPLASGRVSKNEYFNKPGSIITRMFQNGELVCEGVDTLCLNDIRRSKLIYMLANEKIFDINFVAAIFNLNNPVSLYWLRQVAKEKYPENN